MEEYVYLDDMDIEELIQLINEMLDFEETTKALMILEEKDAKKALEFGKDIIKNNKGDDYLQATVWNIFFFDNQKKMIEAVDERKEDIGKTLLDEIIIDLTNHKIIISKSLFKKLKNSYMSISNENKLSMRCKYEEYLKNYFENDICE